MQHRLIRCPSRRTTGLSSLLVVLGATLGAPAQTVVPPGLLRLPAEASSITLESDNLLRYSLPESVTGDVNGDGDGLDLIPHLLNPDRGVDVAIPLASQGQPLRAAWQGWYAFDVLEADQGGDRNGDGDVDDVVPHLFELRTGRLVNLGVATERPWGPLDGQAVVIVSERDHFGQDLNGDGDGDDGVPHWYDLEAGTLRNTGLAVGGPTATLARARWNAHHMAILVSESAHGQGDLNGTPLGDLALHVVDLRTGAVTNVGLVASDAFLHFAPDGGLLAVVSESQQQQDLDGDGSIGPFENVLLPVAPDTGTVGVPGVGFLSLTNPVVAHGLFLYAEGDPPGVAGANHVFRLHGDGTVDDLGVRGTLPVFSEGQGALLVDEPTGSDLNGDGDSSDLVVHALDPATLALTNLGLAATSFALDGADVVVAVPENGHFVRDRNGDGDFDDATLTLTTSAGGSPGFLSLAIGTPVAGGGRVVFAVPESGHGDLNGDGDASDDVLHLLDLAGGELRNLGAALSGFSYDGRRLLFAVPEASQGGLDLDADGTTDDVVPHLITF